ncbi:possible peptidase [Lachnospiraceae bacterium KM106-2]|nr:possible peptidase [Lachnospiraceae bacterium KM106-2]
MIIPITQERLMEAANVYAESWVESHKTFCTEEYLNQHTVEYQYRFLLEKQENGWSLYAKCVDDSIKGIIGINKNTGEIGLLYVLPQEWGKGYGKELFAFVLEQVGQPYLTVIDHNTRAIALYEKFGFRFSGEKRKLAENLYECKYILEEDQKESVFDCPTTKKGWKKLRHKAERRWYRRLVILNLLIIIGIIGYCSSQVEEHERYFNELQTSAQKSMDHPDSDKASKNLENKLDEFPESLQFLLVGVFIILFLPLVLYYLYAGYRSMSIQITERNFPEIYKIVEEYSKKLGLKKVPKIYIVQQNGVLNALSSFIPFKQYIELYADLVEVAYREHHDMDSLRFIIGHEMAHIYLKHATLHYNYTILFANMIPILSSTASRTREYSCDRIAQRLSQSDGIDAMMTLTAGIHLYKRVDKEDYIEHAKHVKGFFVFCYNIASDHPVISKRVLALEMKEGSGKLY